MEERAEGSSNQMKGEEVTMTSSLCIDLVPTVRCVCMQGCARMYTCTVRSILLLRKNVHYYQSLTIRMYMYITISLLQLVWILLATRNDMFWTLYMYMHNVHMYLHALLRTFQCACDTVDVLCFAQDITNMHVFPIYIY